MGNGTQNETLVELLADSSKTTINYTEFISIGFAVDSIDAMLKKITEKSIGLHGGLVETPAMKYFTVKDPNGLNVQFFQQK
jgi:lactoylglutathione lyase